MAGKGFQIGPVPRRRWDWAFDFLARGRGQTRLGERRAQGLRRLAEARSRRAVRLWWGRRLRRCQAVAMITERTGKTGTLYHCPVEAPGVSAAALRELVAAVSRAALDSGLSLVQAMHPPTAAADLAMLDAAGFEPLADLIYMERDLASAPAMEKAGWLAWRHYGQFTEAELSRLIAATYEGSCDCPKLRGKRAVADILAGHKATGQFVPQAWWIVHHEGTPAGCILVNDSTDGRAADLVYLGVARPKRGLGLGRAMIRRAMAQAAGRKRRVFALAVDAENAYAKRIYEAEGFRQTLRRSVRVRFAEPAHRGKVHALCTTC